MRLLLFDDASRQSLYPFTHTRPIADMRCGIFTMRERWERLLGITDSGSLTEAYLQKAFPAGDVKDWLLVHGGVFASSRLVDAINNLMPGEYLIHAGTIIAARRLGPVPLFHDWLSDSSNWAEQVFAEDVQMLRRPWDIFSLNDWAVRHDFQILTANRNSAPIPAGVTVTGTEFFLEEGATIQPGAIINATTGPIYIAQSAEIMEGCVIRGPFALCTGATLKMGAKIYGGTTIGPGCKVGGEVSNVVFFANSNKGHDGFLGNAVIGEWCNLGADSNCSNLKNNYDEVKVWDEAANKSVKTGLTFCGLMMGDHSKCGINTMFNTGTIAGVSCNIWGGGFPEKFIPSFAWGGPEGMSTYQLNRAVETAKRMMARRGKTLSEEEQKILEYVFKQTSPSRSLIMAG